LTAAARLLAGERPRLSAGCVVVQRDDGRPSYLLLRVYAYWDFPKGAVEPGEEPLAAAVREVAEETTLTDLSFPWGEVYRETPPYSGGKIARYYLAESARGAASLPVSPALGRPEHHELRWVGREEAVRLLGDRVRAIFEWADGIVGGVGPTALPDR
jgi:bis(5'-nucleosidyl)-tetraphosphatase